MIAPNENSRRPEGTTAVTVESGASLAPTVETEGNHILPMGATPRDETDALGINDLSFTVLDRVRAAEGAESDEPLPWDERMDWKTSGRHSFDVAPDAPTVAGAGYLIDSDDQRDITECGMPCSLPEDQPVPRVGEPCGSCTGKTRVAGCMCVSDGLTLATREARAQAAAWHRYLATPNELLPVYGRLAS